MKPFQHILITRFNLKNETWVQDKNQVKVLDASWLEKRYQLFDKYCFPSIKNQTEQDFIWLVYFDTETPKEYKRRNSAFADHFKNFIPIYKDSFKHFVADLSHDIKKVLGDNVSFLITSRIDNDDAFHEDAIKTIQAQFNNQSRAIIDLRTGYCLQIKPQSRLYKANFELGPFISLIEKINNGVFETVLCRAHKDWEKVNDLSIIINTDMLWAQIIHEHNLVNTVHGHLILPDERIIKFHFKDGILMRFHLVFGYFKHHIKRQLKNMINV